MRSRLIDHIDSQVLRDDFLPVEYSVYARNQVCGIIQNGISDQAVKREFVESLTIDGKESLDLDDAIWAERTNDGYCVWVHISDVSEGIPLFSPLDLEGLKRTSSIYHKNHVENMIPPELSQSILSLNEDGRKKTLSLEIYLDTQGQVKNFRFFESTFKNLKRYDYENFAEDFGNQESKHFKTLQLMSEIAKKLRANRVKRGGIPRYHEESIVPYIGRKNRTHTSSQNIIEAFMVLANQVTGNFLYDKGLDGIYKQHLDITERSFYIYKPGEHKGLGIQNYTHFTSPIRRYVDLVIHRIIKAILRNEETPYSIPDLKFIAEHANNTRLKIDILGRFIISEKKGQALINKIRTHSGEVAINQMKEFIRRHADKKMKLPQCVVDAIKNNIEYGSSNSWTWTVGIILLGNNEILKETLRKRILDERAISAPKFLNILAQTQIIRGAETLFTKNEVEEHNQFGIKIYLHGRLIVSVSQSLGDNCMKYTKGAIRVNAIEKIFDFFMENTK